MDSRGVRNEELRMKNEEWESENEELRMKNEEWESVKTDRRFSLDMALSLIVNY